MKTLWNSALLMLQSYLPQHRVVKSVLCMLDKTDLGIKDDTVTRLEKQCIKPWKT